MAILASATVLGATAGTRYQGAVVHGAGEGSRAYLQDFHQALLARLGVKSLGDSRIGCVGCERLDGSEITEVVYVFAQDDEKAITALTATWRELGGRMELCDSCVPTPWPPQPAPVEPQPNCNIYYPPTCYSRPGCPGSSTPYCGRYPSGSCASCL